MIHGHELRGGCQREGGTGRRGIKGKNGTAVKA